MDNYTINPSLEHFSDEFIREWNRKRYCTRCGSTLRYDALGEYRCMSCGAKELNDYGKIRKFLDENGPSPARMIESATGVPGVIINELLERGKIEVSSDDVSFLHCSICGTPIKSGRICASCASKQVDGLKGVYAKEYIGDALPEKKKEPDTSDKTKRRRPEMYTRNFMKP